MSHWSTSDHASTQNSTFLFRHSERCAIWNNELRVSRVPCPTRTVADQSVNWTAESNGARSHSAVSDCSAYARWTVKLTGLQCDYTLDTYFHLITHRWDNWYAVWVFVKVWISGVYEMTLRFERATGHQLEARSKWLSVTNVPNIIPHSHNMRDVERI